MGDHAETAALAEIEGGSNSQSRKLENAVDLEISYKRVKMLSERHDYLLEIILRNRGNEPLVAYHTDVALPTRAIERPQANLFFVPGRSSQTVSFFRRAYHQQDSDNIYPGDVAVAMSIPYYVDHEIYFNRGDFFGWIVKATLYRLGFRPLTVEKSFYDLHASKRVLSHASYTLAN